MVKIMFSATLRSITGTRETTIKAENTTIRAVIEKLIQQFGPDFEKRVLDNGEVKRFINLYLNGEDIRHLRGLDSPVKDTDELSILPEIR